MSFLPLSKHRSWPDPNCGICNRMREGGLEPPILSEPDPKSQFAVSSGAPKASSVPLELPIPGKVAEAQDATGIAPDDNDNTTGIATGFKKVGRAARSSVVVGSFKERKLKQKEAYCEACRWRPPKGLALLDGVEPYEMLHAHHALPIACGGEDCEQNLILLCPRCHALAHRLGRMSEPGEIRHWTGPRTREHLLYELRLLQRRDSAGWEAYVERGRHYADVVEIAKQQAEVRAGERRFALDRGDPVIADALASRR